MQWGCTSGVVRVYDSLRMGLSSKTIADMLQTNQKQVVLEHMNMQWHNGCDDCGLFALQYKVLQACNVYSVVTSSPHI